MKFRKQLHDIIIVFRCLPVRRRKQFFLILCMMLIGAVAEFVALGAIVPFITVMADPAGFLQAKDAGLIARLVADAEVQQARLALTLFFLTVVLLAGTARLVISWLTARYAMMVGHDLSMVVYRNMIQQDYMFHLTNSSAELVAAMQKINQFSSNVLWPIMQSITSVLTVSFIFTALLLISFPIAVSALAIIATLYSAIVLIVQPFQRRNSVVIATAQSEKIRLLQEGFGGIRDIIINGLQRVYINRFGKTEYAFRTRQSTNMILNNGPRVFVETLLLIVAGLSLFVVSNGIDDLTGILPTAAAFALGFQRILPYMQMVYRGRAMITSNSASTSDVRQFVTLPRPAVPSSPSSEISFTERLELKDVSFAYGAEGTQAVEAITLMIPKGAFVGITGPSGSGKSTLVDLTMGLQLPTSGKLLIDKKQIHRDNLAGWRARIAHVSQSVFLIEGTIRDNVALGIPSDEVESARLIASLRMAELADFVAQQDNGLDTWVGERGARLSGGQRQRIGIARALYLDRDVLVLDEATSALDEVTQAKVMANIRAMKSQITILSITHRLDTLKGCDTIIELEDGRLRQVIEQTPSSNAS